MSSHARALLLLLAGPLVALYLLAHQPPVEREQVASDWPEPDQETIDYLARLDLRPVRPRPDQGARPEVAAWLHQSGAGKVKQVVCAPDGRTVATADCAGAITLWDLATGRGRRCRDSWGPVRMLVFSPDGKYLAASGYAPSAELWDARTGAAARIPAGVPFLAFGPDGRIAAFLSADGSLSFNDPGLGPTKGPSGCLVVAPDGSALAVASQNVVTIVSAAGQRQIKLQADDPVSGLAFSAHGKTLTVLTGNRVSFWETARGGFVDYLSFPARGMALAPDGRTLAVANWDQSVDFIDIHTRQRQRWLEPGNGTGFGCLAWSPDQHFLIGYDHVWKSMQVRDLRASAEMLAFRSREQAAWEVGLWEQLADANPSRAYPAMWRLAAAPEKTLAFIRASVAPRQPTGPDHVPQLILELCSNQFEVRQRASADLKKLGPPAVPALTRVLAEKPSLEVRLRVEEVLNVLDTPAARRERLLEARTVEVLELIDTPAAWDWLKQLSRGDPGATLTHEAKTALQRRAARLARVHATTPAFELLPVPRSAN